MSVMVMVDVDRVVEGMALARRVLLHNLSRMMILHLKAMLGEKFIGEIYQCSPVAVSAWVGVANFYGEGGRVLFLSHCVSSLSHAYESHGIIFARFHLSPATHNTPLTAIINTALI